MRDQEFSTVFVCGATVILLPDTAVPQLNTQADSYYNIATGPSLCCPDIPLVPFRLATGNGATQAPGGYLTPFLSSATNLIRLLCAGVTSGVMMDMNIAHSLVCDLKLNALPHQLDS